MAHSKPVLFVSTLAFHLAHYILRRHLLTTPALLLLENMIGCASAKDAALSDRCRCVHLIVGGHCGETASIDNIWVCELATVSSDLRGCLCASLRSFERPSHGLGRKLALVAIGMERLTAHQVLLSPCCRVK